jgi:hypothetical protein
MARCDTFHQSAFDCGPLGYQIQRLISEFACYRLTQLNAHLLLENPMGYSFPTRRFRIQIHAERDFVTDNNPLLVSDNVADRKSVIQLVHS